MVNRDDVFKSNKVGKILSPAQKIVIFGALIVAILVFLYSFVLMTPFSDLYQIDGHIAFHVLADLGIDPSKYPPESIYISPMTGEPYGLDLSYFTSFTRVELQTFNHWLFALGFFAILVSAVPLVYFSQKRKIYYKTNLIVVPAAATFNLYVGIHMLVQLIMNHVSILSKVDAYRLINAYQTHLEDPSRTEIVDYFHVTDANPVFILGYIIAFLVIVFAFASFLLTFVKYKHQNSQKQIDLSKVVIHE